MIFNRNPIRPLLDKTQRRFRVARAGSVLILVIVLLVLLALLGTAYLSTTRNDRVSSEASYQNSAVDQYVDGMANVVQGQLIDALFDHSGFYAGAAGYRYRFCDRGAYNGLLTYQQGDMVVGSTGGTYLCTGTNVSTNPASSNPPPAGWTQTFYRNFDSIGYNSGSIIAERHPMWDGSKPYWPSITPALTAGSGATFEDPTQTIAAQPSFAVTGLGYYPTFSASGYPALATSATGNAIVGCSASGDGVADSYLSRIPGAFSDGLTWYYAARVLDDNSAINVNTAWSSTIDAYGLFPTSVGLADLLTAPDSINTVNGYRMSGDGVHAVDDDYTINPTLPRGDYQFESQADALNSQLIRRIKNPGLGAISAAAVGARFNAFPDSETAAMAHGFVTRNPYSTVPSLLEQMLPNTLAGQTTPYTPATSGNWFPNNFNLPTDLPTTTKPMRSMVVARNPVSNYIPIVYDPNNIGEPLSPFMLPYGTGNGFVTGDLTANYSHYKGTYNTGTTYNFGDIVLDNGRTYISVTGSNLNHDPQLGGSLFGNFGFWQLQAWTQNPVKSNANTATFRELFRAYWSVMAGTGGNLSPFGSEFLATNPVYATNYNPYTPSDPQKMFRSSIRDSNYTATTVTRFDSCNEMLLRAALAAVNTIGLRSQTQDVVSQTIYLNATLGGSPAPSQALDNFASTGTAGVTPGGANENVEVRVYSNAPQPYITEVFVDNDTSTSDPNAGGTLSNPNGYMAVEVYNPYNFPISLNNWQLATVARSGAGYPGTGYTLTPFVSLNTYVPVIAPATVPMIPAHSCIFFENYNPGAPGATDAQYRPAAAFPGHATGTIGAAGTNISIYVPGLDPKSITGELVLLRPHRADGTLTSNTTDPLNIYNETANIYDWVPADSYDLTGFPPPVATATSFTLWHYVRGKEQTLPGAGNAFKCVYPGAYYGTSSPRQINTDVKAGFTWPAGPGPLTTTANFAFTTGASVKATYNAFAPIQIFNQGMPGPNPLVTSPGNLAPATAQFPFGAFARNGDILDVPYIGAYRVRQISSISGTPGQMVELNSLPMDCSFADDCDPTDDGVENIGRFCPMSSPSASLTDPDWYAWARNLFTYLTVQNPADDYMPSFDPGINGTSTALVYTPGSAAVAGAATPSPVNSADATITNHLTQDNVGVDGLININTAPWKVLASLDLVPGGANTANNQALAQAIVAYRQKFGPFTSIMDLNKVYDVNGGTTNNFQNGWGTIALAAPTTAAGLLAPPDNFPNPAGNVTSGVAEDFQGQFANLTRISNLITTRSDTYTVYICVEGWQNANNPSSASLKVVRRYAFVADRSAINALAQSRFLKTLTVPNN